MSKKNKIKEKETQNFLDYIPQQNINWETDEETGKVYLIKEKTKNKLFKKIIDWVGKSQHFHIHLDDKGSEVWRNIDGKRNVHEIARHMKTVFGDDFNQAEERVSYFLGMMKKSDFVKLN